MVLADARPRPAAPRSAPTASRRRGPRGEARWADVGALAVGLLGALYALHPLLADLGWWLGGSAVILLVLGVAAVVRRALGRGWLPPLLGAIAGGLVITPVFGGGTGVLGLIPTGETWDELGTLVRRGLASIQEQAIPAEPVPGIMLLLVVPLILIAAVADVIVLEAQVPVLGAVPLLALLVVPVGVQEGVSDAYPWLVALAAWLVLIRRGLPPVSPGLALGAGAVIAAGSLAIPLVLPNPVPVEEDSFGFGSRANPIVDLGTDLRRSTPITVLTYRSRDGVRPYLRLASLSDFSGQVWEPSRSLGDRAYSVEDIPAAEGLESSVARRAQSVTLDVRGVGGRWLPLPYPATRVDGLQGDWSIEPEGLTARSESEGADGQRYSATFLSVSPTPAQLAASGRAQTPGLDRYLDVPAGVDPIVARDARRVTASATTNYAKAVALQNWFRSEFAYSEQAPVDAGYDGSGVGVLGPFLRAKSGYCVHFASAMAVMARQLGIPSRVVVGYLPGATDRRNDDGTTTYQVTSRSLHAWPELYFPTVGWTRFEPTASRGDVPAYSEPNAAQPTDAPTDSPSDAPTAAPTTAPSTDATTAPRQDPGAVNEAQSASRAVPIALGWTGGLLGLLLVLLVPFGVRRGQRLVRYSRVDSDRDGAAAAWAELRDTARDVGWLAPPTETVREFAERLEFALLSDADAVDRVRAAVETEAYARWRGTGADSADLRIIVAALMRTVPLRERLRAVFLPPSLLERVGSTVRA